MSNNKLLSKSEVKKISEKQLSKIRAGLYPCLDFVEKNKKVPCAKSRDNL